MDRDMTENVNDAVKKRALPQWATKLLIWCLPTLGVLSGLVLIIFIKGYIVEWRSFFFLIPVALSGLIITRLILLFRSYRSDGAKILISIVWIVILCFLFVWSLLVFSSMESHTCTTKNAQSRFEEYVDKTISDALSEPLDLGDPESVELHNYKWPIWIFESRSYTLLCKYDDAGYNTAKTALETRYSFRTEPLYAGAVDKGKNSYIEPGVTIGGYRFRFLRPTDNDDKVIEFYKRCLLAVTNDEKREIGYILFEDFDLDVADDLNHFINDYCGWKYVCD